MRRDALPALVLLAAGWALTLLVAPWSDERVNDLFVYRGFAEPVLGGALPYRDAFFEYPPLAAPAIALPGLIGTGAEEFRLAFAGWTLLLAVAMALLCGGLAARSGGERRRALLAAALTPLVCGALVRTHFDLAPVALTLAALALLCASRPRVGFALLGAAVMTKGFALVIVPVALAWHVGRGMRREAWQGAAVCAAVIVALAGLSAAASPQGALDAVRYHLERPVQIESAPAMVLFALDGAGLGEASATTSHRSDGLTHEAGWAVGGAALALMLGALALATLAARRSPEPRTLVLASLAAVTAFAALGKVLSPQFLIWVLPLGALAFAWRMHALAAAVLVAALLTQLEFPAHYRDVVAREPLALLLVAARDLTLLAVLAMALGRLQLRGQENLLDRRRPAVVAGLD
ncbi:MAG TPA: glycosyltransferase 87 family protein [Thermoleophilaceae bacterium]|nr:glycosyltransferase 87 family protein [Thermoleophilaceae bacterium]